MNCLRSWFWFSLIPVLFWISLSLVSCGRLTSCPCGFPSFILWLYLYCLSLGSLALFHSSVFWLLYGSSAMFPATVCSSWYHLCTCLNDLIMFCVGLPVLVCLLYFQLYILKLYFVSFVLDTCLLKSGMVKDMMPLNFRNLPYNRILFVK